MSQSKHSLIVQNEPSKRNLFKANLNFLTLPDKLFIPVGKQLKTLIPEWYTWLLAQLAVIPTKIITLRHFIDTWSSAGILHLSLSAFYTTVNWSWFMCTNTYSSRGIIKYYCLESKFCYKIPATHFSKLTFWRRNYFFTFSTPCI